MSVCQESIYRGSKFPAHMGSTVTVQLLGSQRVWVFREQMSKPYA
jgi:hypothetical protein